MTDATSDLLAERGRTHGDFRDHARVTCKLKDVLTEEIGLRHLRGQSVITLVQREALDMIVHKIGRIIAGNAGYEDHWDDIAGYARLARDGGNQPTDEIQSNSSTRPASSPNGVGTTASPKTLSDFPQGRSILPPRTEEKAS